MADDKVVQIGSGETKPKRGRPKTGPSDKSHYRDEQGLRVQTYTRFKEGVDYEPIEQEQMTALVEFVKHCNGLHRGAGRPPKYEDINEFLGVIDAFWDVLNEKNANGIRIIPDVEGFCCFAGIARDTLLDWEKNRDFEFSSTIKTLKNMIAFSKKQLALCGKIPPLTFATDFNNNHGYQQKQEVVVTPNNPLGNVQDDIVTESYVKSLQAGVSDDE